MKALLTLSLASMLALSACKTVPETTTAERKMPEKTAPDPCSEARFAVFFDTADTSEFDSYAEKTFVDIEEAFDSCDSFKIELEGHADSVGSPEANLALSSKRAESVLNTLISRGISPERIRIITMGDSETFVDDNPNPLQRKVEIRLIP